MYREPTGPGGPAVKDTRGLFADWEPAAGLALGFTSMMPYPAFPLGTGVGLQASQVLSALIICLGGWRMWGRKMLIAPLLLAPLIFSAASLSMTGEGDLSLALKVTTSWAMALSAIIATQLLMPQARSAILTGAVLAICLHVLVGMWQMIAFRSNEFPLLWLYVNPSFQSLEESGEVLATYIQRPFGLFPEPSAMAACVGPWVIILWSDVFSMMHLPRSVLRGRAVTLFAAAGGTALVVASRSGHSIVLVVLIGIMAAIHVLRARSIADSARAWAFLLVCVPAAAVAIYELLAYRMPSIGRLAVTSWEFRLGSLGAGVELFLQGQLRSHMFGLGVGQTPAAMAAEKGLPAIWSVLVTYLVETGAVGLLAVIAVAWIVLSRIKHFQAVGVFVVFASLWLIGVTIVTSYPSLVALWVALGWMSVWPEKAPADATPRRSDRVGQVPPTPLPARRGWGTQRTAPNQPPDQQTQ
jgi:hypothetical protein